MISSGKANVHTVVSIAQAQCLDGYAPEAIQAFASLGCHGAHSSKEERDLYTWLSNLHNIQLEVYYVDMTLEAPRKIWCLKIQKTIVHLK